MTKMEATLSVTRPALYLIEPQYAKERSRPFAITALSWWKS